jgi:hypothetical protein
MNQFNKLSINEINCIFLQLPFNEIFKTVPNVCSNWKVIVEEKYFRYLSVAYNVKNAKKLLKNVRFLFNAGHFQENVTTNSKNKLISKNIYKFATDLKEKFISGEEKFPFDIPNFQKIREFILPFRKELPQTIYETYEIGYVRPIIIKTFILQNNDLKNKTYKDSEFLHERILPNESPRMLLNLFDDSILNMGDLLECLEEHESNIYLFENAIFTHIPEYFVIPPSLDLLTRVLNESKCYGVQPSQLMLNCEKCVEQYYKSFIMKHPLLYIHYSLYTGKMYRTMEPLKRIFEWIPFLSDLPVDFHIRDHANYMLQFISKMLFVNCNPKSKYYGWIILFSNIPDFDICIICDGNIERFLDDLCKLKIENDTADFWHLAKKYSKLKESLFKPINLGTACDGCQAHPIVGKRYHCAEDCNFDLCEKCVDAVDHPHDFVIHASESGRSYWKNKPQQNENSDDE